MFRLIRCSIFPFELLWQAQLSFSVYTGHNQRKLKFQPLVLEKANNTKFDIEKLE